jgi:hypothetical protein
VHDPNTGRHANRLDTPIPFRAPVPMIILADGRLGPANDMITGTVSGA